jgi:hypothetical protein
VTEVAQSIDDRHAAPVCQVYHILMAEDPGHNTVRIAAENPGHVGRALPCAQPHLCRAEVEGVAAQVLHTHFKADTGAQGGFLKEQGQGFVGQNWCVGAFLCPFVLQALGQSHQSPELVAGEIGQIEKMVQCWYCHRKSLPELSMEANEPVNQSTNQPII